MRFDYKVRKKDGRIFQGIVEADNDASAAEVLEEKGYEVLFLTQSEQQEAQLQKKSFKDYLPFGKKNIKLKDIVIFTRQLSVMISANVSVVQALRILVDQSDKPYFKSVISDVADNVESGVKLSSAMGKYNNIFSNFFISMVKSGETSGKLDEVFEYLADQTEKDYDLVGKIKGAMIYPVFIISGLALVGSAMMIFVIPQLTGMLTASGAALPFTTKLLIGTSDFMRGYWWLLIIMLVGAFFGFKYIVKFPKIREALDSVKIRFPVFGHLFQMIYLVRFTQSLATLTQGGVALTDALRIVADVVGNQLYSDLIKKTIQEVEDGNSIASVFIKSKHVPKLLSQMLAVGEKTGRLDTVLAKVGGFYSREIENMVANMTHLIEPFIMVVIGVAVGGMVASIILPMYNLANQF